MYLGYNAPFAAFRQGFESGARDTVELKLDVDPGPITRVRLELEDGPGSTDGWLMSYLELKISDGDQCGTGTYVRVSFVTRKANAS